MNKNSGKPYIDKNIGLEEKTGTCISDDCDRETTATVWPGDPMPKKFCHSCKTRNPDYHNDGTSQGAATIHSQNRY